MATSTQLNPDGTISTNEPRLQGGHYLLDDKKKSSTISRRRDNWVYEVDTLPRSSHSVYVPRQRPRLPWIIPFFFTTWYVLQNHVGDVLAVMSAANYSRQHTLMLIK